MNISIWDSGEFASGKRSAPRLFQVVREAVLDERLRVSNFSYVRSRSDDKLPCEPSEIHERRNSDRWEIERSRVCNTAATFGMELTEKDSISDSDLILIVMRPCHQRSQLIHRAIQSAKTIVFPPYFSNISELNNLRVGLSKSSKKRIILWLPYRYSIATQRVQQASDIIAAMELTVTCSPYLSRLLVHEWALPFLDVMRLGGRFEQIEITRTVVDGLPVFHLKSIQRNSSKNQNHVLGSTLISAAGGTLQNTQAGRLTVYFTNMTRIETTGTFTGYIHLTNELHNFTALSHDQQASVLTGYSGLLQSCLDDNDDNWDMMKPTLCSFSQTQKILDTFLSFKPDAVAVPETKKIIF